jgi:hypothetical protein
MNRSQHRRLEAIAAAVAPCSGCLVEDLHAAEGLLESEARGERIWQVQAEHARERNEPVFELDISDEEKQRRSDAFQEEMGRLDYQLSLVARLPPAARRDSCPQCIPRKGLRETFKVPWRCRITIDHIRLEGEESGEADDPTRGGGPGNVNGIEN